MVIIRNATISDAVALWAIRTDAIAQICARAYRAEVIKKWLAVPMPACWGQVLVDKQGLVATRDNQAVGFGILDIKAQKIEAVFVSPGQAGTGIGRRILTALETLAARNGLAKLSLFSSINAVRFYTMAGYQLEGPSVFSHPAGFDMPCYLMTRQLGR